MTEKDKYRSDFILYFHRNINTDEIFYVGIGKEERAYAMNARNYMWKRYVEKHGKPKVEIYKTSLSMIEAIYLENYFISKIGRRIEKTGNLVNLSKGGEGVMPFRKEEDVIRRSVETRKLTYTAPKGENHWSYGKPLSDKRKQEISLFFKGRKQSFDHIEKRCAPRRGKRMKQESIDKMAKSLRGKVLPVEVKKKLSEASKKMWEDSSFREKRKAEKIGKIRNSRKIIDNNTGIVYNSGKEAAIALGIKVSYFAGMMCGAFNNKTNCSYVEHRPFKSGKVGKYKTIAA